ncbi:methyltransferase [Streptomyces sediminimaris]|uniref:methyltransferase n=1 Tax=Streptomyces sediminimaris TaxID=3383721 RepID=UPI003999F57B
MSDALTRDDVVQVLSAAEGFFPSSVLFALMRLDVLGRLAEEPASAAEVADGLQAEPEAVARLLNAGVMLNILEYHESGIFAVSPPYRSMLVPGSGPFHMGDWVLNLEYFRDALSRLDKAVLTSKPQATYVDDARGEREHTRLFTKAMHNYALFAGRELAGYLDTSGCRGLLEIGAGPGTYSFHLAEANPELRLTLADLPEVLEIAREIEASFRIAQPVEYLGVDLRTDTIEGEYDLVLLSNTLHMLGEDASRELLASVRPLVRPGGSVVVQAQFLDEDRRGPRWPVLLDLLQLCITDAGRNHTVAETRTWLADAGFADAEHVAMSEDNVNSFIRAWKR